MGLWTFFRIYRQFEFGVSENKAVRHKNVSIQRLLLINNIIQFLLLKIFKKKKLQCCAVTKACDLLAF